MVSVHTSSFCDFSGLITHFINAFPHSYYLSLCEILEKWVQLLENGEKFMVIWKIILLVTCSVKCENYSFYIHSVFMWGSFYYYFLHIWYELFLSIRSACADLQRNTTFAQSSCPWLSS